MSSSLPSGLSGGCSDGLLEELDGAGLGTFVVVPLALLVSLALPFRERGFCVAGSIMRGS